MEINFAQMLLSLFNLVLLLAGVGLVVFLGIFGIKALRKYLKK